MRFLSNFRSRSRTGSIKQNSTVHYLSTPVFFSSCSKVYHKQGVRFVLYVLTIITASIALKLTMYCNKWSWLTAGELSGAAKISQIILKLPICWYIIYEYDVFFQYNTYLTHLHVHLPTRISCFSFVH